MTDNSGLNYTFLFALGNERKRVRASQDLHVTRVLSFPIANKKIRNFNPYIYAKATFNP